MAVLLLEVLQLSEPGLVGILSNGYTKSGALPRVAPFRAPIAKLTRAIAAHLSTITNAPYLGMMFGKHITYLLRTTIKYYEDFQKIKNKIKYFLTPNRQYPNMVRW